MAYDESSKMGNGIYPASKDKLILNAEEQGATQDELSKLHNLPKGTLHNQTEVEEKTDRANEEGDGSMENSSQSSQFR